MVLLVERWAELFEPKDAKPNRHRDGIKGRCVGGRRVHWVRGWVSAVFVCLRSGCAAPDAGATLACADLIAHGTYRGLKRPRFSAAAKRGAALG